MDHSIEPLMKQDEVAAALKVSPRYVRASECPKVLLPGNGPKRRPLVRYRLSEVLAWLEKRTARSTVKRAG